MCDHRLATFDEKLRNDPIRGSLNVRLRRQMHIEDPAWIFQFLLNRLGKSESGGVQRIQLLISGHLHSVARNDRYRGRSAMGFARECLRQIEMAVKAMLPSRAASFR